MYELILIYTCNASRGNLVPTSSACLQQSGSNDQTMHLVSKGSKGCGDEHIKHVQIPLLLPHVPKRRCCSSRCFSLQAVTTACFPSQRIYEPHCCLESTNQPTPFEGKRRRGKGTRRFGGNRGKGLQDIQWANGGISWSPLRFAWSVVGQSGLDGQGLWCMFHVARQLLPGKSMDEALYEFRSMGSRIRQQWSVCVIAT
jgi:hypothetical protein